MSKALPILDEVAAGLADVDEALAREKLDSLRSDLTARIADGVLVAFSGGVDSAFLLWVAGEVAGEVDGRCLALTTTSESTPSRDLDDARAFVRSVEAEHVVVPSRELDHSDYVLNDGDRCYHCKTELFRICGSVAEERGLRWLLYGYNASDHHDVRPGQRAAVEAGVLTPLSDAGLTKPEIRFLMSKAGLPLSGKPASPCLSSRIMTGIEITPDRLRHVEEMESILVRAGATTVRVRVCRTDDGAWFLRVEVPAEDMGVVLASREELQQAGAERGYRWVTLDLGGYRIGGGNA